MKYEREEIVSAVNTILEPVGFDVKPKQIEAVINILNGFDTLCILPTGYGKSLIFQILPKVLEKLEPQSDPVLIVVSPLLSLISDQIKASNASKFGLRACSIMETVLKDKDREKCNLFIGTPEAWLSNKGKQFLSSQFILNNAVAVVIDEVHKVTWGKKSNKSEEPFREAFARIGEIRSISRQFLPLLALSATVTVDLTQLIIASCNLSRNMKTLYVCTDRPNIRLTIISGLKSKDKIIKHMSWVLDLVVANNSHKRSLIYCRTVDLAGYVYQKLLFELMDRLPNTSVQELKQKIGIFHAETLEKNKVKILDKFTSRDDSPLKVVVATSCLGCGVNLQNIENVIHFGPAFDTTDYCQQIGRGGRNTSNQCHAVLYKYAQGTSSFINKSMLVYAQSSKMKCLRKHLFTPFNDNNDPISSLQPAHNCCSYCANSCECGSCPTFAFENVEIVPVNQDPYRVINADSLTLVQELLIEYRESLYESTILTSPDVICGITSDLLLSLEDHLPYIDSEEYIRCNMNLTNDEIVKELYLIVCDVFRDIIPQVREASDHEMSTDTASTETAGSCDLESSDYKSDLD